MEPDEIEVTVKVNGAVWTHISDKGYLPSVETGNDLEDITTALSTNKEHRIAAKHIHIEWQVPND